MTLYSPIKVVLQLRCLHIILSSLCSKSNVSCQHTCNVSMDINGSLRDKCVCDIGYKLAEDKHNCVLIYAFLLYYQQFAIKGEVLSNVSEGYTDAIQPSLPTCHYESAGLDFDALDSYIYYSEVFEQSGIYRIHRNRTGRQRLHTFFTLDVVDK